MRLAILSDIHANLEALTKALRLIETQSVDEILCLGDVVGYGANPNECLELVRKHCPIILKGNHDAAAVDLSGAEGFTYPARLAAYWTHDVLTPENIAFLKNLPLTAKKDDLLFVHASPNQPEEWNYILSDADARDAFYFFTEKICFIGHTHVPVVYSERGRARIIKKEFRYLINVGSIGQPRDGNPELSYGIFDTDQWMYENVREDYDQEAAAKKIIKAGLPRVLGDRLLLGI